MFSYLIINKQPKIGNYVESENSTFDNHAGLKNGKGRVYGIVNSGQYKGNLICDKFNNKNFLMKTYHPSRLKFISRGSFKLYDTILEVI